MAAITTNSVISDDGRKYKTTEIFRTPRTNNFIFPIGSLDTPTIVTMNGPVNAPTDPAQIDNNGKITFNQAGHYTTIRNIVFGRTSNIGNGLVNHGFEINSTPVAPPDVRVLAQIGADALNHFLAYQFTDHFDVNASDTRQFKYWTDSAAGGDFAFNFQSFLDTFTSQSLPAYEIICIQNNALIT